VPRPEHRPHENAGRGAADVIEKEPAPKRRRGSCAAPATTVATASSSRGTCTSAGCTSRLWLVGEARRALRRHPHETTTRGRGSAGTSSSSIPPRASRSSRARWGARAFVVDALFGTGLDSPDRRAARADHRGDQRRARAAPFALDLPSGLDAETWPGARHRGARGRHRHLRALQDGHPHARRRAALRARARRRHRRPRVAHRAPGHAADLVERGRRRALDRPPARGRCTSTPPGTSRSSPARRGRWAPSLMVAAGALRAGAGRGHIATWPDAAVALEARVVEAMTARITPIPRASIAPSTASRRRHRPRLRHRDDARAVLAHVLASYDEVRWSRRRRHHPGRARSRPASSTPSARPS